MTNLPMATARRWRFAALVCWINVFVAFIGVAVGGWTVIGWVALTLWGGANAAVVGVALVQARND